GGAVRDIALSRDMDLVSASDDRTTRVWKPTTGSNLAVLGRPEGVTSAAFSPNGLFVVDVSRDGYARVWLWRVDGGQLVERLRGGRLTSARFDSSGTRIVAT